MISAQEACFDFARESFIFATRSKSEARNRIRIINGLRPFIMRSDSELLNWKKDGPAYAVRFCKIRRDKIRFEISMAQVVRFDPKSDDSTHRIIKSKYGIGLQSSKNLTEQSRPGTAAVRNTKVRAGIDALDYEYNHDERCLLYPSPSPRD